jgi:hypothetical protein
VCGLTFYLEYGESEPLQNNGGIFLPDCMESHLIRAKKFWQRGTYEKADNSVLVNVTGQFTKGSRGTHTITQNQEFSYSAIISLLSSLSISEKCNSGYYCGSLSDCLVTAGTEIGLQQFYK